MIFILVSYGWMKASIMMNYDDNTIQEPSTKNYFPIDYEYTAKDGWRVAFALTAYDSSGDQRPFDDSFGTIGAYLKIWGDVDKDGNNIATYFKKLETEPCKLSDINLDGDHNHDSYKFFAPAEQFVPDTKRFAEKLNCIKNDDAMIKGDFNAAAASQLVIKFDVCRDPDGTKIEDIKCKTKEDIERWMNRKFILTLENVIVFQKDKVEDTKLTKESHLRWNVLSPQQRVDNYFYVLQTQLDLSDSIGAVASAPEIYQLFTTEIGPVRPYDFEDNTHMAITYELSRDLNMIKRKVYGILDFLGDVGGLAGALKALFTVAVIVFQYKIVLNYVSNHTYLIKDGDERARKESDITPQDNEADDGLVLKRIPIGFFSSVWLSFQRIFVCCTCCQTRRDKFSHAADKMVKEELKIVGWIQHMRCHNFAMKKLLTPEQWKEVELEAKFKTLAIDSDTNEVYCVNEMN